MECFCHKVEVNASQVLPDVHALCLLLSHGTSYIIAQCRLSCNLVRQPGCLLRCVEALHVQQGHMAATRSRSAPPAAPRPSFSPRISASARALPARSAREMSVGDRLRREAALVGPHLPCKPN